MPAAGSWEAQVPLLLCAAAVLARRVGVVRRRCARWRSGRGRGRGARVGRCGRRASAAWRTPAGQRHAAGRPARPGGQVPSVPTVGLPRRRPQGRAAPPPRHGRAWCVLCSSFRSPLSPSPPAGLSLLVGLPCAGLATPKNSCTCMIADKDTVARERPRAGPREWHHRPCLIGALTSFCPCLTVVLTADSRNGIEEIEVKFQWQ